MEFGQIPLRASGSQTWFPTCRRQVRAISTCRDSSNLVTDWFAPGLRPARALVRELLASWIAPDRPNSTTLSILLAGRRPAREPAHEAARELDSVMEFGLYHLTSTAPASPVQLRLYKLARRIPSSLPLSITSSNFNTFHLGFHFHPRHSPSSYTVSGGVQLSVTCVCVVGGVHGRVQSLACRGAGACRRRL